MRSASDTRDFVASVLFEELRRNLFMALPPGCEAGYMLYDAVVGAGCTVTVPDDPSHAHFWERTGDGWRCRGCGHVRWASA